MRASVAARRPRAASGLQEEVTELASEGAAAAAGQGRPGDRARRGADARACSSLTGMIAADQRAEVTADTAGQGASRVMIERGQRVKMGEPVVRLDVRSAALARARGAGEPRRRARAEAARRGGVQAHAVAARQGRDHAQRVRPPEHAVHVRARSRSRRRRRAREMMAKSVADGIVRAPFDGVVAEKMRHARRVGRARPPAVHARRRRSAARSSSRCPRPRCARSQQDQQRRRSIAVARPDKTLRRDGHAARRRDRPHALADRRGDARPGLASSCPACSPRRTSRSARPPRPVVPATAVVKRGKTWHAFVVVKGERRRTRIVQLGADAGAAAQVVDRRSRPRSRATKVVAKVDRPDRRRPAPVGGVGARHAMASAASPSGGRSSRPC